MKLKRVLVTGAAGFIGSHLTDNLLDYKNHVFTVDNLSGGYINNVNPKSYFTQLDLTDTVRTQKYIDKVKPEIIFHLAADATEGRSQFTPLSSTKNNYLAYLNVLIPAIRNGLKKMVLFSSMSVYGDQKPPFSEKMETKPTDIYGVAKTAMENSNIILSHFPKLQSKKSMIKYLPFRPMEVKYAYCTNDKAERFLKYKEKTNIYKGLTESIKWARKKGHQPFKYLENLELTSKDTPKTWTEQLI